MFRKLNQKPLKVRWDLGSVDKRNQGRGETERKRASSAHLHLVCVLWPRHIAEARHVFSVDAFLSFQLIISSSISSSRGQEI